MLHDPNHTDFDTDDPPTETLQRRPRQFHALRRSAQVLLAGGFIALLSLAAHAPRDAAPSRPPESASMEAFVPSVGARNARPAMPAALSAPRYRLDDPDSLEPVRAEPARLNLTTGQREDVLVQGAFATIEAPYLRITLTEASVSEPPRSLFVTLARRAADAQGLAVIRAGERGSVETRFGSVESLDITLGGDGRRQCTGFASLTPGALRLDGWLCAPLGQAPERRALICALDKITLNGQASPELEGAFAALEARRDPGCGPRNVSPRDASSETGSITIRRTRKNEAKLRPSHEARP